MAPSESGREQHFYYPSARRNRHQIGAAVQVAAAAAAAVIGMTV
jgi:hypothetical protein